MNVNVYQSSRINESDFLNEMEKEETSFKAFLNSLQKCPNKQFFDQKVSSKLKSPAFEQIKKSQDASALNFRINLIKSHQKDKPCKKDDVNESHRKSSQKKLPEEKANLSQWSSEVTNQNRLLTQRRYSSNLKEDQSKMSYNISTHQKTAQNLRSFGEKKLKIEQISSVSWNPDSHTFFTQLHNQQNPFNFFGSSSFLLELLNINCSSMINFLQQETDIITNLNQIQGKQIYSLFKKIFDLQKFTPIKQPLIKKYNNCIFYGQKPNFDALHSGIILYFNGNAYFGSLKNFQKQGLGIDFVYSKNLQEKLYKPDLIGCQSSEYLIFRGGFYKNSKSGQFLIHAQDYVYQGSLVKGFFEGPGTLVTANSIFKGQWSLNKKVSGSQTFKNSPMVYEGEYFGEKFHGKGKLKSSDCFYEGQFKDGLKHGKGILVSKDSIFEGIFQNDKKQGTGILFDKKEYAELNPESENKSYDFEACIYKVEFDSDKMTSKIDFRNSKITEPQNLTTLEQEMSVYETMTIDFENIKPSQMLRSFTKEKLPEKKKQKVITFDHSVEDKRYTQILSVLPKEPEEQHLHIHRKNSYLLGNQFSHSLAKTRKQMD